MELTANKCPREMQHKESRFKRLNSLKCFVVSKNSHNISIDVKVL